MPFSEIKMSAVHLKVVICYIIVNSKIDQCKNIK